ncbi:RSC8 [Candida margitis]|uniref:RSC8 n=1 Tax=Candida margitis TaxID=1775924 RepID=UPI002225EC1E|nr:RSC8 [Candida margitis]KAI5967532.1 RSC8 [Candida margitis]
MSTEPSTQENGSTPVIDNHQSNSEQQPEQQQQQQQPETEPTEEQKPNVVDIEQLQKDFQEKSRKYLAEQAQHVIIPSFAKWFNLNEIHPLEKKSFPDFFSQDSIYKTPQSYKYIRDFLINTFRLNPKEYLTITAVRRNLAGDVTNIIRIHQFLEKWGLINYQIDPKTKATALGPQYTGHFQITLDAPEGLIPFVSEDAKLIKEKAGSITDGGASQETSVHPTIKKEETSVGNALPLNMEIRRNVYSTGESKFDFKPQHKVSYACSICGKDATEVRYHNLKLKSYSYNPNSTINNASILCSICYDQGLFPSNFTSSDFVQFKELTERETWSEQEILLLLEGIEMFGTFESTSNLIAGSNINVNAQNQWSKIAEHVATKTKEECLTKFLQLPIEDKFLHKLIGEQKQQPGSQVSQIGNGHHSSQLDKSNLVEEVVAKLIQSNEGQEVLTQNSSEAKQQAITQQQDLINQITDLTVEKVNLKLAKIDQLQTQLISTTNQLQLERKQVQLTRWAQLDKIAKLKQSQPELGDILSDLMKPVTISEINSSSSVNGAGDGDQKENNAMDVDVADDTHGIHKSSGNDDDFGPISVSKPKEYQFWSG